MRRIKIAVASIDTTVGAIDSNLNKAIAIAREMHNAGCQVGAFQEQLFGGYPAEDLIQAADFVRAQDFALDRFASATSTFDTVFVLGLAVKYESFVYNVNAVICRGKVLGLVPKEHLPTYGVFYEWRVFTPGMPQMHNGGRDPIPFGNIIFKFPFGTMATCVCEDSWTPDGPLTERSDGELQIVTNASPFRVGVHRVRERMLATRSADNECVLVAAYAVGGNDSLVFDGGGFCFQNGQLIGEAPRFVEGMTVFEVDLQRTERMRSQNSTWRARQLPQADKKYLTVHCDGGPRAIDGYPTVEFARRFEFLSRDTRAREQELDDIVDAILVGLDGYYKKTGAFKRILISLSGGWDSSLTLILAWLWARRECSGLAAEDQRALMKRMIFCHSQPTPFNSAATKAIAKNLAEELGVEFREYGIEGAYRDEILSLREITGLVPKGTTLGNVQARIRGMREWNLANMLSALWLQTGNMSEKAVGYTTIGGDMMGGYSLIGNLPKTVVIELTKYLGRKQGIKAVEALSKTRASAELEEGQYDEDQLMPFPVLDLCYLLFVGEMYSPADMYRILRSRWSDDEFRAMQPNFTDAMLKAWIEKFVRLFRQSIFKWVQAPQAVHIGSLDLDRERALQIPVVHSHEYLEASLREMHLSA